MSENHLPPRNQQVCAWLATSVKGIRKRSGWIHYVVQKPHLPWSLTTPLATFKYWNLKKLVRKAMVVTSLAKIPMLKQHQDFRIRGFSFQSQRWPRKSQGDRYALKKEKVKRLQLSLPKFFDKMSQPPFSFLLILQIVVGGWGTFWMLGFNKVLLISFYKVLLISKKNKFCLLANTNISITRAPASPCK